MSSDQIRSAVTALGGLTLLWGFNWLVLKAVLRYVSPLEFTISRTLLGAFVLFGWALLTKRPLLPKSLRAAGVVGWLQITLSQMFTILALVNGAAGKTSVLVFTMPFWTMLLAWPVLGERIRGLQWIAVLLAFCGLVLVVEPWDVHGTLTSEILAILSGLAWGGAAVTSRYYQRRGDVGDLVSFTAWQMLLAALPLLAFARLMNVDTMVVRPMHWTLTYVAFLIYSGVMVSAVGWLLWLYVLQRLPAGLASISALGSPVTALLGSWLIFNEVPNPAEAMGMAMIIAGLALISTVAVRYQRSSVPLEGLD